MNFARPSSSRSYCPGFVERMDSIRARPASRVALRDLARALDQPQVVEPGREVGDRQVRETLLQLRREVAGPGKPSLERVGREVRDSTQREVAALGEALGRKEGSVDGQRRAPLESPREVLREQVGAEDRVHARELRDLGRVLGGEDLAFAALTPLVPVREVERRL